MRAEKWEPISDIDGPCDGISFSYSSGAGTASVSMMFSRDDGSKRQLILHFRDIVVLAGEDEAPGGFIEAPPAQSLPRIEHGLHPTWSFPLIKLLDSRPLNEYQLMRPTKIGHFFLVSFDNLVHVIANVNVDVSWG